MNVLSFQLEGGRGVHARSEGFLFFLCVKMSAFAFAQFVLWLRMLKSNMVPFLLLIS